MSTSINKPNPGDTSGNPPVVPKVNESENPNPPANPAVPKAEGNNDNLDELGYEKTPADPKTPEGKEKSEVDPKAKAAAAEPKKVENPGTGYGDEPPKVEELPPVVKEEPKGEPDEIDKAVGELPKEDAAKVKDFAKKYALTPEQIKAYGDLRRSELKEAAATFERRKQEIENEKVKIRATWHNELKQDKDFGGENFAKSIDQAEKVLEEFMPNTKKHLTEHKTMLPPYVMRDLAKLGIHLYSSTENLVHGDPTVPVESKEKTDDALSFYE